MPEQDQAETVELRDGRFYIGRVEVSEAEAVEAGWEKDFETPPDAASDADTASENGSGVGSPPSVEGRLRAAYKAGQGDRRKTLQIAPGRYQDLAASFRPVDWGLRRKLIRKAERRGESGPEVDLRINSTLMADACVSMLFRPAPGEDYAELHTLIERFKGGEPIRFDSRLAEVLGMDLVGSESEADICRLTFGGDGAVFESHYLILNGWSIQAFEDDEEEAEEEEGGDRPT